MLMRPKPYFYLGEMTMGAKIGAYFLEEISDIDKGEYCHKTTDMQVPL